MDIFSLGCVLAELFLDGAPIFTLAQIFKYKRGEYKPDISGIEDQWIREMILSMISLNPNDRLEAKEYLDKYLYHDEKHTQQQQLNENDNITDSNWIFPSYFNDFLYDYVMELSNKELSHEEFEMMMMDNDNNDKKLIVSDVRLRHLYDEYNIFSHHLGFETKTEIENNIKIGIIDMFPVVLSFPGNNPFIPKPNDSNNGGNEGAEIILNIVLSSLRNTVRATSRLKGCELILALGSKINDEAKLDKCLPYLMILLDDKVPQIRAYALRCITTLLSLVQNLTQINVIIFPEYIIPKLKVLLNSKSGYVRMVLANCLPVLANTALKFQNLAKYLSLHKNANNNINVNINDNSSNNAYSSVDIDPDTENGISIVNESFKFNDSYPKKLIIMFESISVGLLTDQDPAVKISLLRNIVPLCLFFGKDKTNDVILSHLITYLNDKNDHIRLAFVEAMIELSVYVGVTSLEHYILPLLIQTLTDPEESVVIAVIRAFISFVEAGLIKSQFLPDLTKTIVKFILHPNNWIRYLTIVLINSITKKLNQAEIFCILYPIIRPILVCDIVDFSIQNLILCCEKSIPRLVFDRAFVWVTKQEGSNFWSIQTNNNSYYNGIKTPIRQQQQVNNNKTRDFSISGTDRSGSEEMKIDFVKRQKFTNRTKEDINWINKITIAGLNESNLWKLIVMKDYIKIVSRLSVRLKKSNSISPMAEFSASGVLPNTIIFDELDKEAYNIGKFNNIAGRSGPRRVSTVVPIDVPGAKKHGDFEDNDTVLSVSSTTSALAAASIDMDANFNGSKVPSGILFDTRKSYPSVSINQETAFGMLRVPTDGAAHVSIGGSDSTSYLPAFHVNKASIPGHNYVGHNPYILKFLSSIILEPSLDVFEEFGPIVKKYEEELMETFFWEPKGILIGQLTEHEQSVGHIIVSSDHNYFITGSDDGSIRVWDTQKLEKNICTKSSLSMKFGSPIKSMTFLTDRHCFVVGTSDGLVRVIRVYISFKNGQTRLRKLDIIRSYQISSNDYATSISYSCHENVYLLIILTPTSSIIFLDIRTMKRLHVAKNPITHGVPTSICVDKKNSWLLLGTCRGVLDLWDLRFKLHLKSWRISGNTPINKIILSPNYGKEKQVFVVGGTNQNEVTVWDVCRGQCREVYRADPSNAPGNGYEATDPDSDFRERLLDLDTSIPELGAIGDRGIQSLAVTSISTSVKDDRRNCYMVTAGIDRKVIFWNMQNCELSKTISGLHSGEMKPRFVKTHPSPILTMTAQEFPDKSGNNRTTSNPNSETRLKYTKKGFIANEQEEIHMNHHFLITDVAILLKPYKIVVSADRSGMVKLFR